MIKDAREVLEIMAGQKPAHNKFKPGYLAFLLEALIKKGYAEKSVEGYYFVTDAGMIALAPLAEDM